MPLASLKPVLIILQEYGCEKMCDLKCGGGLTKPSLFFQQKLGCKYYCNTYKYATFNLKTLTA